MSRQLLVYLAVIAMILAAGCAEKNTAYKGADAFDLVSVVPVVGSPNDLDRDDTHMYAALDQGGIAVIDMQSFQPYWYTSAVANDGSVVSFQRAQELSVVSEHDRLFLYEVGGTDTIHILDNSQADSLKIYSAAIGNTAGIKHIIARSLETPINEYLIEILYCRYNTIHYLLYDGGFWTTVVFDIMNFPYYRISGIEMDDNYIYAAAQQRGVVVFDKNDGSLISECSVYGEAQRVKVVDGIAYVASRQGGMQILDLTDPQNPQPMGGYVTTGHASQVDYHDGMVAVSSGSGGAYVFDVTNPNDPKLIQRITECGYANSVNLDGEYLTIGSRDDGIFFYQEN